MQFAIEAMRPDGSTLTDLIEAGDRGSAVESLRAQGLMVMRVDARPATAGRAGPPRSGFSLSRARFTTRDLMLFTRQLKMLLEAGAPLVAALEAAEAQTSKPFARRLL